MTHICLFSWTGDLQITGLAQCLFADCDFMRVMLKIQYMGIKSSREISFYYFIYSPFYALIW